MEILIVVTLMVIISAIGWVNLQDFRARSDLDSQAQQIVSTLRKAQNNTLGSKNSSSYGVYFQSDSYNLFQGTSYNAGDPGNEAHLLPVAVEISSISLGGGSAVVFQRVNGRTNNTGSLTLRLKASPATTRAITIEPSGNVSIEAATTLGNTRISDSRHLHFDFSWSIQNASTLNLAFSDPPNPITTQVIPMVSYFNAGKTVFDWSGTVTVGGQDQILRVHTHNLTATSTALSIHRDRRFNTKSLAVDIDGKSIVSYTSAGDPTAGLYGGTMSIQ